MLAGGSLLDLDAEALLGSLRNASLEAALAGHAEVITLVVISTTEHLV